MFHFDSKSQATNPYVLCCVPLPTTGMTRPGRPMCTQLARNLPAFFSLPHHCRHRDNVVDCVAWWSLGLCSIKRTCYRLQTFYSKHHLPRRKPEGGSMCGRSGAGRTFWLSSAVAMVTAVERPGDGGDIQ